MSAALSAWPSAESQAVMGAWPALCVATTTKESLVEVSPSTVTRLNEASAKSWAKSAMRAGAMQASVAKKPSMVAMLGRIMPAPLLMPVTVTVWPPSTTRLEKALGTVSVVMMAWAALAQLSSSAASSACGRPAAMRSLGKGSMITPVENGKTCSGASFQQAGQCDAGGARANQPVFTRARVGVAGVDHHGAHAKALRQVLAADLHGGGAKPVLREHRAHSAAFVEQHHSQVFAVGLAHPRLGDAPAHAGHGKKFSGRGGHQVHGHVIPSGLKA